MDVPEPVSRYFRFAFSGPTRMVRRATLMQQGVMRAGSQAAWSPFSAREDFILSPPGYQWRAVMKIARLIPISILDAYRDGVGISRAAIAGLIPIGGQRGTPEMKAASLLRYLAEAAWVPPALLPQSGVKWSGADTSSAQASLTDKDTTVTLSAEIGPDGAIRAVYAQRYRAIKRGAVLTPWRGLFRDYRLFDGMMVPTEAEVSWELRGKWISVWRGVVTSAHYS